MDQRKNYFVISVVSFFVFTTISIFILQRNDLHISFTKDVAHNEHSHLTVSEKIKIAWYKKPKYLPSFFNFSQCTQKNCELSTFRLKHMDKYKAVIFHYRYLTKFVPKKTKGQIWILWTAESPANEQPLSTKWREMFDWSATYRRESEIYLQRMITSRDIPNYKNYSAVFRRKTKLVAWVVSNCRTPSKRHVYIRELQKFINVDIYGACGSNKTICKNKSIADCHLSLSKEYKFYLGFENSICKDYFTEKVALNFLDNNNMIYVVRSAPNLSEFIPQQTLVNADNFLDPKALAKYLNELGSNETEYIKFLKEKNKYILQENHRDRAFCSICDLLHSNNRTSLGWTGRNFNSWYWDGACKRPSDFKNL